MATDSDSESVEYTPTWVVAVVCSVIVLISLLVERFLHRLGKHLKRKNQGALFQALQKLKEELMLLGFISLLLTVFQGVISDMCIPKNLSHILLPCKESTLAQVEHYPTDAFVKITPTRRHLLVEKSEPHCSEGRVPMLSLEALHQLHIFIFVLAVVHVIFCATTMVLGGAKVELWKRWEDSIKKELQKPASGTDKAGIDLPATKKKTTPVFAHHPRQFIIDRASEFGFWRKSAVFSWTASFFKQFYASVSQSDYTALRWGFIKKHCSTNPGYDFHKYLMRTLQADFKKVVGISWYLWFFVVIFLLLNVRGWHTYFWLSFLPLFLLLIIGAKLEYIITQMAQDVEIEKSDGTVLVKPSDEYFWFHRPGLVLYLIHFILFQNAFEIAFFFWILSTYGFHSCIMEQVGYVIPRLIFGVIIQLLCSYSTLPLYVLVTQMGTMFKKEIFDELVHSTLQTWIEKTRKRKKPDSNFSLWKMGKSCGNKQGQKKEEGSSSNATYMQKMAMGSLGDAKMGQSIVLEKISTSAIEHLELRAVD